MAQQVEVTATKTDNLSSVPGTHGGRKEQTPELASNPHTRTGQAHARAHSQTQQNKNRF